MKVYKFGGASVADAERIRNVADIIASEESKPLIVVVSAMGKTTNALEALLKKSREDLNVEEDFLRLVETHNSVVKELNGGISTSDLLDPLVKELKQNLETFNVAEYDLAYDQIVSFGELISTKIVSFYLDQIGVSVKWVDARDLIVTDSTFREGIIDWSKTQANVDKLMDDVKNYEVILTQGFIGGNLEGKTTTLGREGSDYTAAILSYCTDAEAMAIWKDVPGILTADPRLFDNVVLIDRLSYKEAIEMTYYGAKVIHPKTIKPIQNKGIPLWVKSFVNPKGKGTIISGEIELTYPPMIVIEPKQALIHISTRDFSFVGEHHLSKLFQIFNHHRVRVNMMRNTAISFSVCTNDIENRIKSLGEDLLEDFNFVVDSDLELITVRHYTEELVMQLKQGKIILFEERLMNTIQMVVKDIPDMKRK